MPREERDRERRYLRHILISIGCNEAEASQLVSEVFHLRSNMTSRDMDNVSRLVVKVAEKFQEAQGRKIAEVCYKYRDEISEMKVRMKSSLNDITASIQSLNLSLDSCGTKQFYLGDDGSFLDGPFPDWSFLDNLDFNFNFNLEDFETSPPTK